METPRTPGHYSDDVELEQPVQGGYICSPSPLPPETPGGNLDEEEQPQPVQVGDFRGPFCYA